MSVLTLGETMGLLTLPPGGVGGPRLGIGGAESNAAVGLARLGCPVTWLSRVGDDALGTLVVREIRAEGVAVRAEVDPEAPTGLMLKEQRPGRAPRVRYYRRGSAASRLSPADVDPEVVAAFGVLHVTGITAALGPGPLAALEAAVDAARAAGAAVSFDVNHRKTLWSDAEAAPVLARLVSRADLVFAGEEEAGLVLGRSGSPEELAAGLGALGPATAVVKLGERGALAWTADGVVTAPTVPVPVVDAVGAGDGFVAGFLAERVRGAELEHCLATGNAVGGYVVGVPGDWEGLPTRADLAATESGEVLR